MQESDPLGKGPSSERGREHRVQMDVTAQPQHIYVRLHEPGTIAALHQVAAPFVPSVEMNRVRGLKLMHEPA